MLSPPRSFLSYPFFSSILSSLSLSLSRTRGPFSFPLAAFYSHLLSSILSPLLYSPPVTISLPQTLDRVAGPDSALSSVTSCDCALLIPYKTLAPLLLSCCCLLSHVLRSSPIFFCLTGKNRSSFFPFLVNLCRV
jgi:hypothetical protein